MFLSLKRGAEGVKPWVIIPVALLFVVLVVPLALGLDPLVNIETWSSPGDVAGWTNSGGSVYLDNPSDYLEMHFNSQSGPPGAQSDTNWVNVQGNGIYLTNISFNFRSVSHQPGSLWLYFHSQSGYTWYHVIPPPNPTEWTNLSVSMSFDANWYTDSPHWTAENLSNDLKSVEWIGLYIARAMDSSPQDYLLDDFRLEGVELDTDGDGMPDFWENLYELDSTNVLDGVADRDGDGLSNYGEYRAGTHPTNGLSRFVVDVDVTNMFVAGVIEVRWPTVSNRTYALKRGVDLKAGLTNHQAGMVVDVPQHVYQDGTATNSRTYFYQVIIEE